MREDYTHQLENLSRDLVTMTQLVQTAITDATDALLSDNVTVAQRVIDRDVTLNSLNADIEERCIQITALQAPLATDLRFVMGAIRIATSLERMGDLASHVAKQVRLRHPNPSIPAELQDTFAQMGEAASLIIASTGRVIEYRDTGLAADIKKYDDALDVLHRELFTTVLSPTWSHGVEAAIDVTLLSRFYERFGDHAVTVARRITHIVTGEPYAK
ncbi:MAG: phosphate signaling complex protein PhoU [Actinomycetes bacterium]